MKSNRWTLLVLMALTLGSGGALLHNGALANSEPKSPTKGTSLDRPGIAPEIVAQGTDKKKAAENPGGTPEDADEKKAPVEPKNLEEAKAFLKERDEAIRKLNTEVDRQKGLTRRAENKLEEIEKKKTALKNKKSKEDKVVRCALGRPENTKDQRKCVAKILKKMRPEAAAKVVAKWSQPLAIDILFLVKARIAAPVLAAMPSDVAAKITAGMAAGKLRKKPDPPKASEDDRSRRPRATRPQPGGGPEPTLTRIKKKQQPDKQGTQP